MELDKEKMEQISKKVFIIYGFKDTIISYLLNLVGDAGLEPATLCV